MAHRFIPLLALAQPNSEPAAAPKANIAALPVGQAAGAASGDFKSLANTASLPSHQHRPKISVQRDGERITKIQIICSCQEVIELDCVY